MERKEGCSWCVSPTSYQTAVVWHLQHAHMSELSSQLPMNTYRESKLCGIHNRRLHNLQAGRTYLDSLNVRETYDVHTIRYNNVYKE